MASPLRAAWLLNLDAEMEYASPIGYTPNRSMLKLIERCTPSLTPLVADSLIVSAQGGKRGIASGLSGFAWSPTPHALRQLARSSAVLPKAPDLSILQQANSRQFCASQGQSLAEAEFMTSAEQAIRFMEGSHPDKRWLVKRVFGFAGRGQRRMRKELSVDDRRWLHDSQKTGGVQVEPLVTIVQELCLHGYLTENEALTVGELCIQETDEHRAWKNTRLARPGEISKQNVNRLRTQAQATADALARIGYFGPFGIDAFVYLDGDGRRLNPLSEINARYSMGYAVGMPNPRRDSGAL